MQCNSDPTQNPCLTPKPRSTTAMGFFEFRDASSGIGQHLVKHDTTSNLTFMWVNGMPDWLKV